MLALRQSSECGVPDQVPVAANLWEKKASNGLNQDEMSLEDDFYVHFPRSPVIFSDND